MLKDHSDIMDKLKSEIEEYAKLNSDNQKYMDDLNFDVTNLKISVSSFNESELSIDEMVERLNQDIENNKSSITNKKAMCQSILNDNEELKNKILEYEEAISKINEKMLNSDETIQKLEKIGTKKIKN